MDKEKVVKNLAKSSMESIPKDGINIGDHKYGCVLKVIDQHLSLEITPESLRDLLVSFLRSDFRTFIFMDR